MRICVYTCVYVCVYRCVCVCVCVCRINLSLTYCPCTAKINSIFPCSSKYHIVLILSINTYLSFAKFHHLQNTDFKELIKCEEAVAEEQTKVAPNTREEVSGGVGVVLLL